MTEHEQWAFQAFATAHPVEAHAEWPERFWRLFREMCPGVDRPEMERRLAAMERERAEREDNDLVDWSDF